MKQRKTSLFFSEIFRIFAFVIIGMATTLTVQAADVTFNGTTNTDWAEPTNWSSGTVPTSADVITIAASKSVAIANGTTVSVERMILLAGSSLTNSGTLTIAPTGATTGSALTVSGNCSFVNQGTLTVNSANQTTATNAITINGATNAFTFNGTNNLVGKTSKNIFAVATAATATIGGAGFTVGMLAAPSAATVFLLDGTLTIDSGTTINMFIGTGMKGVGQNSSSSFTNNGVIDIKAGTGVVGTGTWGIYIYHSTNNTSSTFTNNGTLSASGFARPALFGLGSGATTGTQTFTNNGTATFTTTDVASTLGIFVNKNYAFSLNNTGTLNLYSNYRAIQLFDNTSSPSQQINNTGTINITKGVVASSTAGSVATYPAINNNLGGIINFNYGFPSGSKIATEKVILNNNSGAKINGSCTFSANTLVTATGSTLSPGDFTGGVSGYGFMILTPSATGTKFPLNGNVSMQIKGKTTAGTDYDRINCTEIDVTYATMTVAVDNSYTPVVDDEIPLIYAATSKTGPLSNTTKPRGWISITNTNNESAKYKSIIQVSTSANITELTLAPTSDVDVANDALLTINDVTTINSLTVAAGSMVTNTSTLNTPTLTLNSNATDGTGTYINNGTSNVTTLIANQYLGTTRNWYISSPVVSTASSTSNIAAYYEYIEAGDNTGFASQAANSSLFWKGYTPGAAFMTAGKGYIALPSASGAAVTFSGTMNTGDVSIPLSKSLAGYNLIGNPYPCHLTWTQAFATANASKIYPTIWVRTNSGSSNSGGWSFNTHNALVGETVPSWADVVIAPMQAFWVKAKVAGQTLVLNSDLLKSHQAANPLKAPTAKKTDRQRVRLQVSNGTTTDETLIYFDAAASNTFDDYDSQKYAESASETQIYSKIGDEKLVINGMNAIELDTPINVGFVAGNATAFSVKANEISNIPVGVKVILKDNATHAETDLTDSNSYSFTSDATSNNTSRFTLTFKSPSAITGINYNYNENVWISTNTNGQIIINTNSNDKTTVDVYNSIGQKLESKTLTSTTTILYKTYFSGVYLVSIISNGKTTTKKLVIN